MRFWKHLSQAIRLRCPLCGCGKMFRGWFKMHEHCSNCGIKFEREPGYFLGSIYFNYGLTALVVAIAYPVLMFNKVLDDKVLMPLTLGFVIVFPIIFFRHARALWAGFDQLMDPRESAEPRNAAPSEDKLDNNVEGSDAADN
jgi:uncharacterized protein (DUF983 family)